jgi:hypothetical protein
MKIAVIGRGETLIKFNQVEKDFDRIFIVNHFSEEMDLLGDLVFKNSEIIHVVGRGPNNMPINNYKRLNIRYVQANQFSITDFNGQEKNYPIEVKTLSNSMRDRGLPEGYDFSIGENIEYDALLKGGKRSWPTTGVMAIDLAIDQGANEIWLFGIDCYRKDYAVKKNNKYQNSNWGKSKAMIWYIGYIVKSNPNIRFHTSSDISYKYSNWEKI